MCYKELELETGKYYDVISSSDNNEYKRLKLIEFNYTGIDSVLLFSKIKIERVRRGYYGKNEN